MWKFFRKKVEQPCTDEIMRREMDEIFREAAYTRRYISRDTDDQYEVIDIGRDFMGQFMRRMKDASILVAK